MDFNLPYNPGWGRSQEVYGENSMHMGKMGSGARVKGLVLGLIADLVATIVIDLIMMGRLLFMGQPAEAGSPPSLWRWFIAASVSILRLTSAAKPMMENLCLFRRWPRKGFV